MNDPVVLLLFLATWGGIVLLFRRLTDDFRKVAVRQSDKPAQIDEELLRITGEVQETIEGLSDAMSKRAEQLRTLLAEADTKIAALEAAIQSSASPRHYPATEPPSPPPAPPAQPTVGLGHGAMASAASDGSELLAKRPLERSVPWPAEPQLAPSVPPAPSANGRAPASEVLRLAAEGHDLETIARLTNRGREEVRLLIGTKSLTSH